MAYVRSYHYFAFDFYYAYFMLWSLYGRHYARLVSAARHAILGFGAAIDMIIDV